MSLSGVDTSQMMARFTTTESQKEWGDVKEALLKAFPDQTFDELQAAATAVLAKMPDVDINDLLMILGDKFNVVVSVEHAAAIRTEWEEFTKVSDLEPSELMEVLDDYTGDEVKTNSQRYLLLLMKLLRQELIILFADSEEADLEADKSAAEAALDELSEEIKEQDNRSDSEKRASWFGAAVAVVAAVVAVTAAVATFGLLAPIAAAACVFAGTALASAISGEDYSIASVASDVAQWLGIPKDVADVIGVIVEVSYVLEVGVFNPALAVMGEAPRIFALFAEAKSSATEEAMNTDGTQGTDETEGNEGVDPQVMDYEMSDSELASLKEALVQMVKMLKAGQALDAAMLNAIFNSLKNDLSDKGSSLVDMIIGNADVEIA